jgi:hypothetical protein
LGRDQLHATLSVDENRFSQLTTLNNRSYSLATTLDWSAADRWSGVAGLETAQQLYRYDLSLLGGFTGLNLERNSKAYFRARVGMVTLWTFESGVQLSDRHDSATQFGYRNLRQSSIDAGMRYQPSPDLGVKGLLRYSRGKYPDVGTAGDRFHRTDLESSVLWQATGASALDARLTLSQEGHSLQTVSRKRLWSGAAGWKWAPTGKLLFTARLTRDSDTGANTAGSGGFTSQYNDAKLRTMLALGATWAVTGKIQLNASANYARRSLDSALLDLGTERSGSDTAESLTLGVTYAPMRAVDLGCNASYERRSVNGDAAGLSYPYSARVYSCYGQAWWR